MKFVLQNIDSKEYYKGPGYNWINNIDEATHFTSQQSAMNVINITFAKRIKEENLKTTVLIYDKKKNTFNAAQMTFDYSSAREKIDAIKEAVQNFDSLSLLRQYWESEQSKYDRMTQDILHKIELETVTGIEAVRLVKKLKEIRQHRREAKDNVTMLGMLISTQIGSAHPRLNKYLNGLETRTYSPKELPELFN